MPNTNWSELSHLQLGRYAEYYAKMEFASYGYECFILGKHTARNGVAGISPPRREFQKC